jgi:hypothetical protein
VLCSHIPQAEDARQRRLSQKQKAQEMLKDAQAKDPKEAKTVKMKRPAQPKNKVPRR